MASRSQTLNEMKGEDLSFCTRGCVEKYKSKCICSQCGVLLPRKYYTDPVIDNAYGKIIKRFCCNDCLYQFKKYDICSGCNKKMHYGSFFECKKCDKYEKYCNNNCFMKYHGCNRSVFSWFSENCSN